MRAIQTRAPTRASILTALAEPATTTTLARGMRLSPGAVSQHLSILYSSGLVSRTRVAGTVLYRRTARGDVMTEQPAEEPDARPG